jgi:hypothetical protein
MITPSDWIRQRAVSLELLLIRYTSFLETIPLLRHLHRNITAGIELLGRGRDIAAGVRVQFKTPYLHLPLEVDKTQIGHEDRDRIFRAAAFRFFDWHTWTHIEGEIDWIGARTVDIKGKHVEVITGFVYTIGDRHPPIEHIGLRLAEGVEGTARILRGREIKRMRFEPVNWMLIPDDDQRNVIAIRDMELMTLIVSLSVIGGGNQQVYAKAIDRLEEWIRFTLGSKSPEKITLEFLRLVRDWGPLRMEPLFYGLKEVLERLRIPDQEKILFEFYADNWGVWDNRHGRLLAVKMLEALGTEKARLVLNAIHNYAKHREVKTEELELIQGAIRTVSTKLREGERQR